MTSSSFSTLSASALDELMAAPTGQAATSDRVLKSNYQQLVAFQNMTSYSTQQILHACPRKFQIKKLQAATGTDERVNSITYSFGHAVGAGVATYDATQNLQAAILEAFFAWDYDLLAVETKGTYANGEGKPTGKSFAEAIWALMKYEQFFQTETDLADYESVKIEGTLLVDFENGHYYSGHIDELLRNKFTGRYRVKENKTTGLRSVDPVMYSNSDQALSYAVVVDMLGGSDYSVLYTVYSSSAEQWFAFEFVKTALKKAEWLQDQMCTHSQIDHYSDLNFFPKRGGACFDYMRRCELYERCDLKPETVYGVKFADLPMATPEAVEAIEHVDYFVRMSEIVERQRRKLTEGETF